MVNKEKLIEDYFLQNLSAEEKSIFDNLYKTNDAFKKEVQFQEQLRQGLYKIKSKPLKSHFKDIENNKQIKRRRRLLFYPAATILLMLGLYWFVMPQITKTNDELFLDYYNTPANISYSIARDDDSSNEIKTAFISYDKGDFEQSVALFEKIISKSDNSELLFYYAISQLETNNLEQAILLFENHISHSDRLQERSRWYLALAYLKKGDEDKAYEIAEKISNDSGHYNNEEASKLIKSFAKFKIKKVNH